MRLKFLALTIATTALVGCGNKGNSGGEAPAAPALPPTVTPEQFDGPPGDFSGTWRGDCVVESQGQTSQDCSMVVTIKQRRTRLEVAMSHRYTFGGYRESDKNAQTYTVRGNRLVGVGGREGRIGPKVLTLVSAPPSQAQPGYVRLTFVKEGERRLKAVMEAATPQYSARMTGDLRTARPIPRARVSPRR